MEYYPNFVVFLLLSVLHTRFSINMTNVRFTFGVLVNTNIILFFLKKSILEYSRNNFFSEKEVFLVFFPISKQKKNNNPWKKFAKKKYWKYFRNYSKIWKIVYRYKYQNFVEIFQVWKNFFWYFSGILWEYTRNILFQKNFNKILPRYQHYSWNIFWSFGIMLK